MSKASTFAQGHDWGNDETKTVYSKAGGPFRNDEKGLAVMTGGAAGHLMTT